MSVLLPLPLPVAPPVKQHASIVLALQFYPRPEVLLCGEDGRVLYYECVVSIDIISFMMKILLMSMNLTTHSYADSHIYTGGGLNTCFTAMQIDTPIACVLC